RKWSSPNTKLAFASLRIGWRYESQASRREAIHDQLLGLDGQATLESGERVITHSLPPLISVCNTSYEQTQSPRSACIPFNSQRFAQSAQVSTYRRGTASYVAHGALARSGYCRS